MFNLLKKEIKGIVYSPVKKGKVIKIEEVPDDSFAQKLLGEGVGFINEDNALYAPCNGLIIMTQPTKHAIGIKSNDGVEILIHIGLDTVDLNGKGFTSYVKKGDKVKKGDMLISFDKEFMVKNNIDLVTPMVITNSSDYDIELLVTEDNVNLNREIIKVKKMIVNESNKKI